jgi:formylglycine-generating enzyme required for sulfatase activity
MPFVKRVYTTARLLVVTGLLGCARPPVETPAAYTQTIPDTTVAFPMLMVPGDGAGLRPFWLAATEVSWEQFELFAFAPPSGTDAVTRPSQPWEPPDHGMGLGRHPAVNIRREAAEAYCRWLSERTGHAYRLPTEAEWRHACALGALDAPPLDRRAWHRGNSDGAYHQVGSAEADGLGLHDMLGNVWEYVSGPEPVMLGGSWDDPPDSLSCQARQLLPTSWSRRDPMRPRSRWWLTDGWYVGFRVARDGE